MNASPADVLNQPLDLGRAGVIPNRLGKAAMTEGLADASGVPTEALCRLYRVWSQGGAGLQITGNVQVDAQHLERPGNVIINRALNEDELNRFRDWTAAAKEAGNQVWMQISHAGRQTQRIINSTPKAPSAIPLALPGKLFGVPVPLKEYEILEVIERFAAAAVVARDTGFDGVQIHAAHGYLISQFLSPLANQRDDLWGGSLENRARLLLKIVEQTRQAVGHEMAICVKLNSADFQRGGFEFQDSLRVAQWLSEAGVDMLEMSGGNYESPRMMNMSGLEDAPQPQPTNSTAAREAYFLEFAAQLREAVSIPLMVTGGFRTARAMASAVSDDGVSVVGIGRPLCVDPACPAAILSGAEEIQSPENGLRVGPGWFGPESPVALLKAINGFAVMSWYYQQIRRMGRGEMPNLRSGVFSSFVKEQSQQMSDLRALRRAMNARQVLG